MWIKDFYSSAWSILVISLSAVSCLGWKPIAPPVEYFATKPKPCVSDCDLKYKNPFFDEAGEGQAETQLKSTLLNQPIAFNHHHHQHIHHPRQSNQKLDLDLFKPTEVSFFPKEKGEPFNAPFSTYQEVLRKSPVSFYSFKSFAGPQKSTKTIYYGDLELAKPKLTNDVKYYKAYKNSDVKLIKPAAFVDNEVAYRPLKSSLYDEHCSLYKVSFRQDHYYQYIQYKVHMPELKEFTLCLWSRFHNHSHDHSLFSYSAKHHRKAIYMWVSNLNSPAFFSMKVMGQTLYRLNYPIKLYKWYHTCQSWNGNTGEWQVWVNSHRIARGFHNLLVGHSIPGGGLAISGQEQRFFSKGYQEIRSFFKGTAGLEGEITMLQMYKVALTAGKAYNDHSHHHSHYTSTTPEPPDIPTEEPSTTTAHPFLENGQLKKHINILELAEALKAKGHLDTPDHQQFDFYKPLGQPYVGPIAPLTVHGETVNFIGLPNHAVYKRNDESRANESQSQTPAEEGPKQNAEKVKFINNVSGQVQVDKIKYSSKKYDNTDSVEDKGLVLLEPREGNRPDNTTSDKLDENFTMLYDEGDQSGEENNSPSGHRVGRTRLRRHNPRSSIRIIGNRPKELAPGEMKSSRYSVNRLKRRGEVRKSFEPKPSKRQILFEDPYVNFGTVGLVNQDVHTHYGGLHPSGFSSDQFHLFGQDYPDVPGEENQEANESPSHEPEPEGKKEVELAEGEVKRVMELCSGCQMDPFRKVAVISWRSTPKKIYSGALFLKAQPECDNF